jgi:hypothetical protein
MGRNKWDDSIAFGSYGDGLTCNDASKHPNKQFALTEMNRKSKLFQIGVANISNEAGSVK